MRVEESLSMRSKYIAIVLFLVSGILPSHAKRDKVVLDSATATAKGVMEARVEWVKDKKSKFDYGLVLTNLTESGLIVYLHDIACKKGKVSGETKHTFFNTGEKTIDFKPGETKRFKLVCRLNTEVFSNDYSVGLRRINSNPNYDGKTVGKLLYKDLNIPIKM
jgi:hypothetical protein